jgi:hypothetical protein
MKTGRDLRLLLAIPLLALLAALALPIVGTIREMLR